MGSRLTPLPIGDPPSPDGASSVERRARVEELARLVRTGRYEVPAALVADAIIRFHRREP